MASECENSAKHGVIMSSAIPVEAEAERPDLKILRPDPSSSEPDRSPRSVSSGFEWKPTRIHSDGQSEPLEERLKRVTPTRAELSEWARRPQNQPPQSWLDDETDPFEPVEE